MKKITLLLTVLILLTCLAASAKRVEIKDAKLAGMNFYFERLSQYFHQSVPYSSVTVSREFTEMDGNVPVYYIFNFNGNGYIIVSADDCCFPVIGYSFDSQYDPVSQPDNFVYWMGCRKQEISGNIKGKVQPDLAILNEWNRLSALDPMSVTDNPSVVSDVTPLLTSLWDQGFPYNVLCPADPDCGSLGGHVTVGCVATAMSQIMYYWRWPNTGTGLHCYYAAGYGQQCANFGATTYDWNGMNDSPSGQCDPVALISYHAGVSVNMMYNSDGQCSSGAYQSDVPNALKNYFQYATSCISANKSAYSTSNWSSLLTGDLSSGKPIQYGGQGAGGGHSWVCDGYQGTDYFHMNWGWSGSSNGYFYLNNLNPGGYTFNSQQSAVLHIEPNTTLYPTFCSGNTLVNTYDYGTIEDGSGPVANYQNNGNCSWLIAPDDSVKNITLTFEHFNTAAGDEVKVYDGENASAPLIGTYSGSLSTMPTVTSAGAKMFITFTTDGSGTANGWMAGYKANLNKFCESTTTMLEGWATISDGSGRFDYRNLSSCRWNIMPAGASKIVLTVNSFKSEPDVDKLLIYDLGTGTLMATLSGTYGTLPGPFTSTTGKMMLQWFTNNLVREEGWEVSYSPMVGTDDNSSFNDLSIYPNPAGDVLNVEFSVSGQQNVNVGLLSIEGKTVFTDNLAFFKGNYLKKIDVSGFAAGIYMLRVNSEKGTTVRKIVIQ